MSKTISYIFILVICGLISCRENQNQSSTGTNKSTKDLEGYWILTDYLDSILSDRTIAKHSRYPICEEVLSFRIHNDSLFSKGIIMKEWDRINLVNDTLKQSRFSYIFHYNSKSDLIEATPRKPEPNGYLSADKEKYIYRRVTEKRLLDILQIRSNKGFHQLFIDSLIAGKFKSLKNGKRLILTNKLTMSGFEKFNKYEIFDYLEFQDLCDYELNLFHSYDAIIFREDKGNYSEDDIPKWINIMAYNWQFSGDTLTLTEMRDTIKPNARFGEHLLGEKKISFIRVK